MAFSPRDTHPSIDAAWRAFVRLLPSAPTEREELAFKGGASVLFYALIKMMDPGDEPTEADLARMDKVFAEIEAFTKTFDQRMIALNRPVPPRQ